MTFASQLASAFTPIGGVYDSASVTQALSWAESFVTEYCNRGDSGFDLVTSDIAFIDPKPHNTALLPSIPVNNVESVSALLPPQTSTIITSLSATASSTGGTFAPGSYFWTVTAILPSGEMTASNEVSATLTGSTSSVALSWTPVQSATGYNVYRGIQSAQENVRVTTLGAVTSYTDTGSAGSGGVAPTGLVWTTLTNYRWVKDTGEIYDTTGQPGVRWITGPSWPWVPGGLQVTYDHGYATVPQGLINVACRFAQQYLENPALLLQRDVGDLHDRFAGNTGGVGIVINDFDKYIMDRYRLVGIG